MASFLSRRVRLNLEELQTGLLAHRWIFVDCAKISSIAQFVERIKQACCLQQDILLFLDGYYLPSEETITILKDGDIIRVSSAVPSSVPLSHKASSLTPDRNPQPSTGRLESRGVDLGVQRQEICEDSLCDCCGEKNLLSKNRHEETPSEVENNTLFTEKEKKRKKHKKKNSRKTAEELSHTFQNEEDAVNTQLADEKSQVDHKIGNNLEIMRRLEHESSIQNETELCVNSGFPCENNLGNGSDNSMKKSDVEEEKLPLRENSTSIKPKRKRKRRRLRLNLITQSESVKNLQNGTGNTPKGYIQVDSYENYEKNKSSQTQNENCFPKHIRFNEEDSESGINMETDIQTMKSRRDKSAVTESNAYCEEKCEDHVTVSPVITASEFCMSTEEVETNGGQNLDAPYPPANNNNKSFFKKKHEDPGELQTDDNNQYIFGALMSLQAQSKPAVYTRQRSSLPTQVKGMSSEKQTNKSVIFENQLNLKSGGNNTNSVEETLSTVGNHLYSHASVQETSNTIEKCEEEKQNGEDVKCYTQYHVMNGYPRRGDIIVYKILEMSENYTPQFSDYKEARVEDFKPETETVMLQLLGKSSTKPRKKKGKFDIDLEEEPVNLEESTLVSHMWSEIIEPRLIYP